MVDSVFVRDLYLHPTTNEISEHDNLHVNNNRIVNHNEDEVIEAEATTE